VVIFKRVHDEFLQKCRENKLDITVVAAAVYLTNPKRFVVRDFVYSEEQIAKQREEFDMADTTEKELWVCYMCYTTLKNTTYLYQTELLRLSRTNFSESFQILVHLKVIRLFVESVLRYGLPANYVGIVIKVL
jgi:V-type H+-transporting ATPase subunit C